MKNIVKKTWKWVLLGIVVFVLAFCVALPLFLRFSGGLGGVPTRIFLGQGMMNRGPMMMGGFGFGAMGLLMLAARCIVPILVVAGVIVLIVYLVKRPAAGVPAAPAAVATKPCPACGKPIQEGWVACPFCGQKV